jgi:microcystin-dependent protein
MDAFTGEIRIFGFSFPPYNWAWCNGQSLPVFQYPALNAVIGTLYGGTATSLKLPNLQGSAVADQGTGVGLTPRTVGSQWGQSFETLGITQLPSHQHPMTGMTTPLANVANEPTNASHLARTAGQFDYSAIDTPDTTMANQMIGTQGGGLPHENRQPYLAMNFCICLYGDYPIKS